MSQNYMSWKIIWVEIISNAIIWVEIIWNVTEPLKCTDFSLIFVTLIESLYNFSKKNVQISLLKQNNFQKVNDKSLLQYESAK